VNTLTRKGGLVQHRVNEPRMLAMTVANKLVEAEGGESEYSAALKRRKLSTFRDARSAGNGKIVANWKRIWNSAREKGERRGDYGAPLNVTSSIA